MLQQSFQTGTPDGQAVLNNPLSSPTSAPTSGQTPDPDGFAEFIKNSKFDYTSVKPYDWDTCRCNRCPCCGKRRDWRPTYYPPYWCETTPVYLGAHSTGQVMC